MKNPWKSATVLSVALLTLVNGSPLYAQSQVDAYQKRNGIEEIEETATELLSFRDPEKGLTLLEIFSEDNLGMKPMSSNADYSLAICQDAEAWFGVYPETDYRTYRALSTMTEAMIYQYFFEKLSIPEEIWRNHVSLLKSNARLEYENLPLTEPSYEETETSKYKQSTAWLQTKDRLEWESLNTLMEHLNAYLAENRLPYRFGIGGGCGSASAYLKVDLNPPNTTFSFIPVFNYMLCEKRGIDPNSSSCQGWRSGSKGIRQYNTGRYIFRVLDKGKTVFSGEKYIRPSDTSITLP